MRLKRIGVLSTGLMLGVLYGLLGVLFGGLFSIFSLFGAALGALAEESGAGVVGALFGIGAVIFFPIFYGILGFIGGIILALFYNLTAKMTGGIEMHFEKAA